MKKTFVVFAVVAFAFASCGNESQVEEKVDSAQEKADEMTEEMMKELENTGDAIQYEADTLMNDIQEGAEEVKENIEEM